MKENVSREVDLTKCIDAYVWAKEFMRLYKKFGYEPDEETIRGWFASAIMAGYDEAIRRHRNENSSRRCD